MVSERLFSPCAPAETLRILCAGKLMQFYHFFFIAVCLEYTFFLVLSCCLGDGVSDPRPGRSCRAKLCSKCPCLPLASPSPRQALPLSRFMASPVIPEPIQNHPGNISPDRAALYKQNHFIEFFCSYSVWHIKRIKTRGVMRNDAFTLH